MTVGNLFRCICSVLIIAGVNSFAQDANKWVKVTYYDFHSNRTNPNFEKNPDQLAAYNTLPNHVVKNMIKPTLTTDCKPQLNLNLMYNDRINEWFRPSGGTGATFFYDTIAKKWGWVGLKSYNNRPNEWVGANYSATDSMANVIIFDSLQFTLVDAISGIYRYSNTSFLPLNGRGFGAEPLTYPEYNWTNPGNSNFGFAMEMHETFIYRTGLKFNFEGDDDVWAFIDNKLVMDIGGIHGAVRDSIMLDNLNLVEGKKYNFDFFYAERHVTGSDIIITTNMLTLPRDLKIQTNAKDTIAAGDSAFARAIIKDDTSGVRPDYEKLVTWTLFNQSGNPPLSNSVGPSTTFYGTEAYRRVGIIASFTDPLYPSRPRLIDTIYIYVKPGPPDHLSIESSPIVRDSLNDEPLSKIMMADSVNTGKGYAIARDKYGNYVRLADSTTIWTTINPAIATVAGTINKKYEGTVTRVASTGQTYAIASEGALRPDSVLIDIAAYYIKKLRIVDKTTGAIVPQITMTTGQQQDLVVYGLRSNAIDTTDPNSWVTVTASWLLSAPLKAETAPPIAPSLASEWLYKPANPPGTGTLTLTYPDPSNRTPALIVPVTITRENPTYATITILTPLANRIAGEPILTQVKIYNSDGLVPDQFCYGTTIAGKAAYQDALGTGGRTAPTVTVDGITVPLNQAPSVTSSANECFTNGVGTVNVVLYYAPYSQDTLHRLSVQLPSIPVAFSEPFLLKPGALDSLAIEDITLKPVVGPVVLNYPTGFFVPYADGYDKFGNRIGPTASNWKTDQTLHMPKNPTGVDHVVIETQTVTGNENGNLCATVNTPHGPEVACVNVSIVGPQSQFLSGTTRDINGNGYLDRIDLVFNKKITMPGNGTGLTFQYGNVSFKIDSVVSVSGQGSDSLFIAYIQEVKNGIPQTAWTPAVSIKNISGAYDVDRIVCIDGAPPVIWSVVKTIGDTRASDLVTVTLSEKINDNQGSKFNIYHQPSLVLNVWHDNGQGLTLVDSMLSNIAYFKSTPNDSVFTFNMTNDRDLTESDYLNLVWNNPQLEDKKGNDPVIENQKVRVMPDGQRTQAKVIPNPSAPTFKRQPAGFFELQNQPNAMNWVATDRAGSVVRVTVTSPDTGKIQGYIKIYDMVGNLVNVAETRDLLRDVKRGTSSLTIDVYWNGSNAKGMKVSPGIYRAIVYLQYESSKYKDTRLATTLGIGR